MEQDNFSTGLWKPSIGVLWQQVAIHCVHCASHRGHCSTSQQEGVIIIAVVPVSVPPHPATPSTGMCMHLLKCHPSYHHLSA